MQTYRTRRYRFVFVGAGPTTIAMTFALMTRGVDARDILVIDPYPPMGYFEHCVHSIGMQEMRSGWGIDVTGNPEALRSFARSLGVSTETRTPPWWLLRNHSVNVWASLGIEQAPSKAIEVARTGHGWTALTLSGFVIETTNLIIATGLGPHRRSGILNAVPLPDTHLDHQHEHVSIMGGGMTAAHAAISLIESGTRVTMFCPRGLRLAERDAKPEWFDPSYRQRAYLRRLPIASRYELVQSEAEKGTVHADMYQRLRSEMWDGRLIVETNRVEHVRSVCHGGYDVVDAEGEVVSRSQGIVYDARGFEPHIDHLRVISGLREAVGNNHFRGLPVLKDETGEVQPGLILAGGLAALSHGPIAHTIAGAVSQARSLVSSKLV